MRTYFIILFTVFCTGCSVFQPQKDNSTYYMFSSGAVGNKKSEARNSAIVISINSVPEYLSYPYIAKKVAETRLIFDQSHRWAINFKEMCQQLIVDEVSKGLDRSSNERFDNIQIVSGSFAKRKTNMAATIVINISDLIYDAQKNAVCFKCQWSMVGSSTGSETLFFEYENIINVAEEDYDEITVMTKKTLSEFAAEVADKLVTLI